MKKNERLYTVPAQLGIMMWSGRSDAGQSSEKAEGLTTFGDQFSSVRVSLEWSVLFQLQEQRPNSIDQVPFAFFDT